MLTSRMEGKTSHSRVCESQTTTVHAGNVGPVLYALFLSTSFGSDKTFVLSIHIIFKTDYRLVFFVPSMKIWKKSNHANMHGMSTYFIIVITIHRK